MTGDWIKLRKSIFTDQRVMWIADRCSMSRQQVVGWLACIWCWADQETADGVVPNVSLNMVQDVTTAPDKLLAAMRHVGWILESPDGVSFPNFDEHMSESAKKRAIEQRKKQKSRARKRVPKARGQVSPTQGDNTVDQRREEKSKKRERVNSKGSAGRGDESRRKPPRFSPSENLSYLAVDRESDGSLSIAYRQNGGITRGVIVPPSLAKQSFVKALDRWVGFVIGRWPDFQPLSLEAQLSECHERGYRIAAKALDFTIAKGGGNRPRIFWEDEAPAMKGR